MTVLCSLRLPLPLELLALFLFFSILLQPSSAAVRLTLQQQRYLSHEDDDECNVLLEFGTSFTITRDASPSYSELYGVYVRDGICDISSSYPKTRSWKQGTACCSWEGVTCSLLSGNNTNFSGGNHVNMFTISQLDLSCSWLQGVLPSNSALFSLHNLEKLNLAGNDFSGSQVPSQFGVFTRMTYLNLSHSNLTGLIPAEISHLSNLIYLDLSTFFNSDKLEFDDGYFERLVQNLTKLKELALTNVDMSKTSLSSMRNLSSTLTSFQCSSCAFQGTFPSDVFHLPNLRRLDLSSNSDLTGTLPPSNWTSSSLLHLDLSRTGFHGELPDSICGLKNLEGLGISGIMGTIPDSFWNLTKMSFLDLTWSNSLSGHLDFERLAGLQNLQHLGLRGMNIVLDGSESFTFRKLEKLILIGCNLTKFPNFLSLSSGRLKKLDLSNNVIDEEIPRWFWMNKKWNLEVLDLSGNKIRGGFPPTLLFQLKKLQYVKLRSNLLNGPLPEFPPSNTIAVFNASYNEFTGSIPPSTCEAGLLHRLSLSNNNLTGTIPRCLGNLSNLQSLYLGDNRFTGDIPPSICQLTSLAFLQLSNNNFTGQNIPTCFGNNLRKLVFLQLAGSQLEGNVPSFVCRLTSLESLLLGNNNLASHIPTCLGSLSRLSTLDLRDNHFSGEIPTSICQLTSLKYLILSENNLTGHIPTCLGNLSRLRQLDLGGNQLEGPLPPSIANCTSSLQYLNISYNRISEAFPLIWSRSSSSAQLEYLDLQSNNFEGPLPVPPPTVQYYILSNNNFTGRIPSSICNAAHLIIINLSNNSLSGPIPPCFMNFNASLSVLNLRANTLNGQIPSMIFVPGNSLRTIDLRQNQFAGILPRSLANCKDLEVLDLGSNMIEDSFPSWLGILPKLKVLVLRANKFYGHVIKSFNICLPFFQLRIFDIARNKFAGPLPSEYIRELKAMMDESTETGSLQFWSSSNITYVYQDSVTLTMKGLELELVRILTVFTTIDLSGNSFQGVIPEDIGNLRALKGLNFSHNNLGGSIPFSIGNLKNLEWLDLSSNDLTGEIPNTMVDLTFLAVLNLSMNQLTGPIPSGSQFNTFNSNSFEGNPELCGTPLPKACLPRDDGPESPPTSIKEKDSSWIEWRAVVIGYGSGLVIGISVGYIYWKVEDHCG